MKSIFRPPLLLVLLTLGSAPLLQARENTGDLLASLVESVDHKLSNLQVSMQTQQQTQSSIKSDLERLRQNWEQSTEPADRVSLKSEIVRGLSELNTNDRLLIAQSMETLLSVDQDLQRLQQVFRDGVMGPERLERQRSQVRQVLLGVGPLLATLEESLDSQQAKAQAASTEQTLILLYQQLDTTSVVSTANMLEQITMTTEAIEEVAAQLAIVQGLLEMERYQLEVVSQVSITELLFARLGQVSFGDKGLVSVPRTFQDGVAARNKAFSDVLSNSALLPTQSQSPGNSAILNNIRNGNLPQ